MAVKQVAIETKATMPTVLYIDLAYCQEDTQDGATSLRLISIFFQ